MVTNLAKANEAVTPTLIVEQGLLRDYYEKCLAEYDRCDSRPQPDSWLIKAMAIEELLFSLLGHRRAEILLVTWIREWNADTESRGHDECVPDDNDAPDSSNG